MKRFGFRLQPLLDIKMRREDELKRELAIANGAVILARRRSEEIRESLERFQTSEKQRRTAAPTAQSLRLSIMYRYRLQRDIKTADAGVEALHGKALSVLQLLTEAKKQRRTLETLRDKKLSQWKLDYKREEQEFIDDVSQKEYIRQKNGAAAPRL